MEFSLLKLPSYSQKKTWSNGVDIGKRFPVWSAFNSSSESEKAEKPMKMNRYVFVKSKSKYFWKQLLRMTYLRFGMSK